MFPIAVIIATIAMMAGIGGALFFSPLFLVGLNLEPKLALATSLFIEFFGFSSGVIGYLRAKSVNFYIVKKTAFLVIVSSFLGVIFASYVPVIFLKSLLILLLLYLSFKFLTGKKKCKKFCYEKEYDDSKGNSNIELKSYHYPIFVFASLLLGMISSGLGEINEYLFLKKFKMSSNFASGTSVFLIAIAAISGVLTHLFYIFYSGESRVLLEILPILLFSIPGVLIGAQLGVASTAHLKTNKLELYIGLLFLIIVSITIYSTFLM